MTIASSPNSDLSNNGKDVLNAQLTERIQTRTDRNTHDGQLAKVHPETVEVSKEKMMDSVRGILEAV